MTKVSAITRKGNTIEQANRLIPPSFAVELLERHFFSEIEISKFYKTRLLLSFIQKGLKLISFLACEQALLLGTKRGEPREIAARSRVLASLAQIGQLARRLSRFSRRNWLKNKSASDNIAFCHAAQTP